MANDGSPTVVVAGSQPVPEDKFEKITVLLPTDTVAKLDRMAQIALLGSRGRAIQALVDAVVDSAPDVGQILVHGRRLQQLATARAPGIRPAVQTIQEQLVTLNALTFNMGQILTRLNKFLGMRLVEQASQSPRKT